MCSWQLELKEPLYATAEMQRGICGALMKVRLRKLKAAGSTPYGLWCLGKKACNFSEPKVINI